ncbi:MAG: hypothetical protein J4451_00005 [DPANN group archaeon]|nr:hypothetical protein [DPANN group archaeon]
MKKTSALILGVVFVLSILAGATSTLAVQTSVVPVLTVDDSGQSLTVDSITAYHSDGTVAGKKTDVNSAAFVLEAGTYTMVAKKAGYKDANSDFTITAQSPQTLATTILTLQKDPNAGSNGSTGSVTGTGTTSEDLTVDVEIDNDKVGPGDVVTFDLEIENTAEYDAEDVQATVEIRGIDGGDDIDASSDKFTLNDADSGKEIKTLSLTLKVPFEADENEYTVVTTIEWKNEDTNEKFVNEIVNEKALEVEKEDADVRISELTLSQTSAKAEDEIQVDVTLFNVGKEDQDVKLTVKNKDLNVDSTSGEFQLDADDKETQHLSFTVPKNAKSGEYTIQATVTFGDESKTEFVMLTVDGEGGVKVLPLSTAVTSDFGKIGVILGLIIALIVAAFVAKEFVPAPIRTEVIRRR